MKNYPTSTPHRSETNGIAERAVRRAKEGTSAVLLQPGLGNEWWADSLECHCYLRNIQDLLSGGKHHTKGGSECHLTDQQYRLEQWSNITQFLRKTNLDCTSALYAERIWKGDIMVADIEELEEMDTWELHARRLNAKDVLMPSQNHLWKNSVWDHLP